MANRFLNNITINDEYTLPAADGTADQVLTTDGAGQLVFVNQDTITSGSAERVSILVKNGEGTALVKGDPVYIIGSVGASNRLEVGLCDASDPDKMPCVGLLEQNLAINGEGNAVTAGKLRNIITTPIDGQTTTENETIYVKAGGSSGSALTTTKPTGSTNLIQNVGQVGRVSTSADGNFVVSAIMRTNDVPNLPTGKIWVGDGNTITSSIVFLDEPNGRMGVGTTSPGYKLDVSGGFRVKDGSSAIVINEYSDGATIWLDGSNGDFAGGDYFNISAYGTTDLAFGYAAATKITMKSDGKLGIGTTSPSAPLDVRRSDTSGVAAEFHNSVGYGINVNVESDGGNNTISSGSNQSLAFATNGASNERMRITSAGDVAIGNTSSLGYKLYVNGNTYLNGTTHYIDGASIFRVAGGGSEVMRVASNGNVGIGTTSPATKLNVAGDTPIIRLTDTRNMNVGDWDNVTLGKIEFYTSDTTSPGARVLSEIEAYSSAAAASGPESELRFKTSEITDSSPQTRMTISAEGDIGIGTTSPTAKLHVVDTGSTSVTHYLKFNNEDSAYGGLTIGSTGDDLRIRQNAGYGYFDATGYSFNYGTGRVWMNNGSILDVRNSSNSTVFYIPTSGNVGIGTTSPSQKLDVDGAIITEDYRAASVFYLTSGGDWRFRTDTGIERVRITSSGNVGIGETLPDEKLEVSGNIKISGGDYNGLYFENASGTTKTLLYQHASYDALVIKDIVNNADRVTFKNNGNVGIGTTSPVSPLTVKSNSVSSGNSGITVEANGSTDAIIKLAEKSGNGGRFHMYDGGVEKIAFYTDGTDNHISAGNVGIGTTSPSYKLQVEGGIKVGSDAGTNLDFANAGVIIKGSASGNNSYMIFEQQGVANWRIGNRATTGNFDILSGAAGSERLTITSAGNVGIGTTSPASKLDVAGTGSFTGQVTIPATPVASTDAASKSYVDAQVGTADTLSEVLALGNTTGGTNIDVSPNDVIDFFTGSNLNYGRIYANSEGLNLDTVANRHMIFSKGSSGEIMRISTSGNVGIGTTSPAEKLEVSGSIKSGNLKIEPSNGGRIGLNRNTGTGAIYNNSYGAFQLQNNGTGFFELQSYNSSGGYTGVLSMLESNGNVGIGTTSPDSKLSVTSTTLNSEDILYLKSGADNVNDYLGIAWEIGVGGNGPHSAIRSFAGPSGSDARLGFLTTSDGGTTLTEGLSVAHNGNVGIGVTNPQDFNSEANNLVIGTGSGAEGMTIYGGSSGGSYIYFADGTSGSALYEGFLQYRHSERAMRFGTATGVRMTLDASGRVGIGTTSPSQKLTVVGNAYVSSGILLLDDNQDIRWGDAGERITGNNTNGLLFTTNNAERMRITSVGYTEIKAVAGSSRLYLEGSNGTHFLTGTSGGDLGIYNDTANSYRMFIKSSGNVGIGTTSPSSKLHVSGTGNQGTQAWFGNGFVNVASYHYDFARVGFSVEDEDGADTGAGFQFNTRNSGDNNWMHGYIYQPQDGGIAFGTGGAGTTAATEKMRIDSSGNVMIGNTSAAAKLDIRQDSGVAIRCEDGTGGYFVVNQGGDTGIGTTNPSSANGFDAKLQLESANPMLVYKETDQTTKWEVGAWGGNYVVYNGTNERMRIDSSGNVGIGVTSLSAKLDVTSATHAAHFTSTGDQVPVRIISGQVSNVSTIGFQGANSTNSYNVRVGAHTNDFVAFTANTERMRIDSSGDVTIGVGTNYGNKLTIYDDLSSGSRPFAIRHTTGDDLFSIYLNQSTGETRLEAAFDGSTDHFTFYTQGAERVRIDSDGNVGIGTTSPSSIGTGITTLDIEGSNAGGVAFGVSGTKNYIYGASTMYVQANTTAAFLTSGTEKMRITSGGNVGIGTTNPYSRLNVIPSSNPTSPTAANQITVGESSSNSWYNLRLGYFLEGGAYKGSIQAIAGNTPNTLVLNGDGGNVGIGTTSPGAKLQIGSATYAPNANLGNNLLQIKSPSGFAYLTIGNGDSANSTSYIGGASGFTVIGSVTDAGALSEHMRITNTGNVAIGDTTSNFKLKVQTTGWNGIQVNSTTTSGAVLNLTTTQRAFELASRNNSFQIRDLTAGDTPRLTINSSGNVGIGTGTTSPGTKLEVEGTTTTDNIVYDRPSATGQYRGELVYFGSFAETTAAGDLICLGTDAGSPVWRLANNGNSVDSTGMLGIALGSNPDDGILVRGYARSTAYSSLVDGGKCYISGTNGDMTTTAPGTGTYLRIVGYVIDNVGGIGSYGEIYFCPDNTWVEIA